MKLLIGEFSTFGKRISYKIWMIGEKLTNEQKQGIIDAIEEIDSGKGIAHQKVMENIRKKFTNV